MKKYNFEKFLINEGLEGYRQSAFYILYCYVEKRKTHKISQGTITGNLNQPEVTLRKLEENKLFGKKSDSEAKIVSIVVTSKKI